MVRMDKKLNSEQLKAVKHGEGPLLIIAGAGTGKTTVITERIKHLISNSFAKPSEILALTFTEKASKEMEERVDVALPLGYTQMWISTFHAFCDRILRREALHIGLDPRYKLMTQTEAIQFVRKNLFEFDLDYFRPLGNPNKFIEGMLAHFSRLGDEDLTPTQYVDWVNSKLKTQNSKSRVEEGREEKGIELSKWRELSSAYQKYTELKIRNSVMDFSDLIGETLTLFRRRSNVLAEYRKQFKYILVDEFQDTNVAQYELVKLLCPPKEKPNLTLVGDDSQSIYKFRGAAISNILKFTKDYKKAKSLLLNQNYRSGQDILDSSYKLIQFNNPDTLESRLGISKKLKSSCDPQYRKIKNEENGEVVFIHEKRVENEAERVASEIKNLVEDPENSLEYKDCAVLIRANNHADPFIRAFQRVGLPYQFLGPGKLFRQPEIVDLISYLKVLNDIEDSQSFFKVLSADFFEVDVRDLISLINTSKKQNKSLFEVCERISEIEVNDKTKSTVTTLVTIIQNHLTKVTKDSAGQLVFNFLTETGFLKALLNPDTPEAQKRAKNITKFFDKLKTYEVEHEDASVSAVVDYIDLASELGESPLANDIDWQDSNAINILTIHSAKGLEFPIVFLVNLVSQRFPTLERREQIPIPEELIKEVLPEGDYHLQEERRLMYVGMTRAKERLYLTAADYYGEGKRAKKLSPFIFEALGEEFIISSEKLVISSEQLSILDYKSSSHNLQPTTYNPQPIHVDFLSYSQIQTFDICPLHYKLHYIYKIPTPSTSAQSFGNSFHLTMQAFYEAVLKGEKPTDQLMQELLEKNWLKEGYISKTHETKSFEKALGFLKRYLVEKFNPQILPAGMEIPFTVPIDMIRIGGKIDRVDVYGDTIEIIDYKTGAKALTQKEADRDLQLSIYALAATTIPEFPFNRLPDQVKLTLMYFDTPQTVTTTRTLKQLEDAKKKILEVKKEIETSDFNCSGNMLCENCEYKLFCQEES